jgi:hypothetical protein
VLGFSRLAGSKLKYLTDDTAHGIKPVKPGGIRKEH